MNSPLLLVVAQSYRLPGLGLLAVGQQAEPALRQFALHTKLPVQLTLPGGTQQTVPASVEELSRPADPEAPEAPAAPADFVLLLESELVADLPPGTEIRWLRATAALF